MYIVVSIPAVSTQHGLSFAGTLTSPSIEYYQTKDQLMDRLRKGGNIRVFEATELQYKLDVMLTPKDNELHGIADLNDIRFR